MTKIVNNLFHEMHFANFYELTEAPKEDNPDQMLAAISRKGFRSLKYADPTLLDNAEFMLDAARLDGSVLDFASERLRKDTNFVQEIAKINTDLLCFACPTLLGKADFMLSILRDNPPCLAEYYLQHASPELKANGDFMLDCIRIDPSAIKYARMSLRNNKEFIAAADKIAPEIWQKLKKTRILV